MRLAFLVALTVLGLASCAAHNSHRVQVDLAGDFDPLVDEAYAQLLEQWPANEPGGTIGTRVAVEPVAVRWSPLVAEVTGSTEPTELALPIPQQAMTQRVEARLWQLMGGPPDASQPPEYVIAAKLQTDLHDPKSLTYGLSCSLARADKPSKTLARGYSRLIQLPRLFCHGCNESWSGHGSRLVHPATGSVGYVGFWAGLYCPPSTGDRKSVV